LKSDIRRPISPLLRVCRGSLSGFVNIAHPTPLSVPFVLRSHHLILPSSSALSHAPYLSRCLFLPRVSHHQKSYVSGTSCTGTEAPSRDQSTERMAIALGRWWSTPGHALSHVGRARVPSALEQKENGLIMLSLARFSRFLLANICLKGFIVSFWVSFMDFSKDKEKFFG